MATPSAGWMQGVNRGKPAGWCEREGLARSSYSSDPLVVGKSGCDQKYNYFL